MLKNRVLLVLALFSSTLKADEFELYVNTTLQKMVEDDTYIQKFDQLYLKDVADADFNLSGSQAGFVLVKTNEGRNAKILLQFARQKINNEKFAPMVVIERFVTYREGQERTVLANGKNIALFNGFRFNLDLGQIVPAELNADIEFGADDKGPFLRKIGQSKLFLVKKRHPEAKPEEKANAPVVGPVFDIKYFNGNYLLQDDGRRSGKLKIEVDASGDVSGSFYSDKDGQKYDIRGKVGGPAHSIQFVIKFPRIEQTFQGFLFTGDAKAIAGTSRLIDRESGFFAIRE